MNTKAFQVGMKGPQKLLPSFPGIAPSYMDFFLTHQDEEEPRIRESREYIIY